MSKALIFICILITVVITSCTQNDFFSDYKAIEKEGWNKDSLAVFNVDIDEDRDDVFDIDISVRNLGSYGYSNLWLFVSTTTPQGETLVDTLECPLAEPSGRWLGTGTGSIYHNTFTLEKKTQFSETGTYIFSIQHGMRAEQLKGISDVGIRIAKNKDEQE